LEELRDGAESFGDVFTRMWHRLSVKQLVSFSMTSWSIWKRRNFQLWENKIESPNQTLHRAQAVLNAWECARRVHQTHTMTEQQPHAAVWQPPRAGLLKCNVDASISTADQKISMGAVLRDSEGRFVRAMTNVLNASMSPAESEAWGLHQGLKWITTLGHQKVIFESDCKMLVDDVHSNKVNHSEYGLIVKSC